MRIFLISPVRRLTLADEREVSAYVARLEAEGHSVHWPLRDTPQDIAAFYICEANRAAMAVADEVHVWWSEASEGSRFDLGMVFAFAKPIRLARRVDPTTGKSFANVLLAMAQSGGSPSEGDGR